MPQFPHLLMWIIKMPPYCAVMKHAQLSPSHSANAQGTSAIFMWQMPSLTGALGKLWPRSSDCQCQGKAREVCAIHSSGHIPRREEEMS